ncbi:MAG TPA: MarC family protein [Methylophilaceae bacterium]|jgi:multiple antibiotic resistance protein|nr:MarC family protein [Methylophilaceae bacterium]
MDEWSHLFKVGIALFAIVNPIGTVPIFVTATEGWSAPDRARTVRIIALTVFTVLTVAIFIGDRILEFFGISIPSFQVGGGILLLLMAISMMHGRAISDRQTTEEAQAAIDHEAVAIVPLSIPLLAGPGAISSIIITAEQSEGAWGHLALVIPVLVVAASVWAILGLSMAIANRLGAVGIIIVTRLMGLILAAMAIEFMTQGLGSLFPGWRT